MKVFLTGGTGFIGMPLVRSLLRRGWQVTALARRPDSAQGRALARLGARCVPGDVTSVDSMREAMRGCDVVIHNAAWYELGVSRRQQRLMHDVNLEGTRNVLELALELGVPRCVHVSSVLYYGGTGGQVADENYRRQYGYRSYYEQSKTEAHALALQYRQRGLPLLLVCPANVFGPNDHSVFGYFLRMYLNGIMFPLAFSPGMRLSPVYVDDVSEGIALAAERGRVGETYVLSGEVSTLREMFNLWNAQAGGLKIRIYMPRWLAWMMLAPMAPLLRLLGLPAFLSAETVAMSSGSFCFSSAKAQRELGWTPLPLPALWQRTFEGEIALLAGRRQQTLLQRLKPLEDPAG